LITFVTRMQGFRDAGSKMPNVRCKDDETCASGEIRKYFSLVVGAALFYPSDY